MVYRKRIVRIIVVILIVSLIRTLRIPSDGNFAESQIPHNIIQINSIRPARSLPSDTFQHLNPQHVYRFFNDTEAEEFVRKHMPWHIVNAFNKMPISILKADYFRYIVIYILGGVYSDMDTTCLRPINTWTDNHSDVGFIVGIEAENCSSARDLARPLQLCQWTFASKPHHPILNRIIEKIAHISETMQQRTMNKMLILDWTGPGIWTDVIFDFLKQKYHVEWQSFKGLQHGRLIGDVYILPITAFQPTAFNMGAKGTNDSEARVVHHFLGKWKINLASRKYKAIRNKRKL